MTQHDLDAVAFPRLDEAQLAALEGCPLSKLKHYRDGEKLFEAGQCDCNFYVVKSGAVEIVDDSGDAPKIVATLGPGEFTGEVAQLTGGPAIVSGVARGECDVLRGLERRPAEILNVHPDLGDVILQAFIARRHLLHEIGGLHGPARDRLALLAGHLPRPRLPGQEPGAVHLAGPGGRPAGEAAAQAVRADRGRHARGRLGPQAAPAQPLEPRAGGGPRPPPAAGADGVRPGRGRRRPGGAGRGRLRRLRGAATRWCWSARRPGARPAAACGSRTTSASPPASPAASWPSAPSCRPTSSGPTCPVATPVTRPDVRQRRTPCCTSTAARRSRPSAC